MVTYVGASWASGPLPSGPLSWPAGTASGDLAVLMLLTPRKIGGNASGSLTPPSGWNTAAVRQYYGTFWSGIGTGKKNTWEAIGLAWKFLKGADLSASLELPESDDGRTYKGAILVYRDTAGVGGVRDNYAYLPVGEAGGVVSVFHAEDAFDTPPGVTRVGGSFEVWPRHIPYSGGGHEYQGIGLGRAQTALASPSLGATGRLGLAVEILGPQPPDPPVWTEPADQSEVAHNADLTIRLAHRPVVAGGQADAYRVQVAVVAGGTGSPVWDRWLTPAGTLSATEQTVTLGAPAGTITDTVPDALLTAGDRVVMRAQTRETSDQRWSTWSPELTIWPVNPPSATVTSPTGTVTDDLTPTITYTVAGGPHGTVQARIVGPGSTGVDDGILWDSGLVSTTGLSVTADVADYVQGGQHRAWVRVRTVGGAWSAWASGALFTMSWTPPAAPTVTATYGADEDGTTVTITGADVGDEVDIQRLDPLDGWVDVSRVLIEDAGPLVVTDVRAPYGADVVYRARVRGDLDGAFIPGDWGESGPVRNLQACSILVDAEQPLSRWLRVRWREDSVHVHEQVMSVSHGIGDPRPRVSTGTYQGLSGSWVFRADTVDARAALVGFIHSCQAMTLVTPPEREPDGTVRAVPHLTVRRASPLEVGRLAQVAISQRDVAMGWVEADPVEPRDTTTGIAGGTLLVTNVAPGPGGTLLIETTP